MMIRLLLATAVAAPAQAAPNLLTDLPLTAGLVSAVSGEDVPSLLDATSDEHHAALKPSQARALGQADIFFMVGAGLTPWLSDVATLVPGKVRALAEESGPDAHGAEEHADHHGHDHADEGHADDHEGHAHEHHAGLHPWLDPRVAKEWLDRIAEDLAEADPQNAGTYRENATAAQERIDAAGAEVAARLRGISGGILVVHDAWDAATEAFGLPVLGAVSDSDAARPGARHLRQVDALLAEGQVSCLLASPGDNLEQARRLASEHDLPIVTVPLIGAPGEVGLQAYLGILEELATLSEACIKG